MFKPENAEKTAMRSGLPLLLLFTLATLPCSWAGGDSGGGRGGSVFVGPGNHGRPVARMADLVEAELAPFRWPHATQDGTIRVKRTNNQTAETQFENAIKRLRKADPYFANLVEEAKESIFAKRNPLKAGTEIQPDDSGAMYTPKGMELKGMMLVNPDTGNIDVREDLFSVLETQTDVAAAWMHEAIYKVLRERGDVKTSRTTRRLVGCLFAEGKDRACLATNTYPVPQAALTYECTVDQQRFTLVPSYKADHKPGNDYFRDPKDVQHASSVAVRHEILGTGEKSRVRAYGANGKEGYDRRSGTNRFQLSTPKAGEKITRTEPNVDPLRDYGYGDQMDIGITFDKKGNATLDLRRLRLAHQPSDLFPPRKRSVKCRTVLPKERFEPEPAPPVPEPPEDDGPPTSVDGL